MKVTFTQSNQKCTHGIKNHPGTAQVAWSDDCIPTYDTGNVQVVCFDVTYRLFIFFPTIDMKQLAMFKLKFVISTSCTFNCFFSVNKLT